MLAIYLLTLGVSAGVVGVFFRTMLAEAGYIPEFQAGVAVAVGAASAYIALQLLFMTVIRFFWPTRSHVPVLADCVSHGSVVFLLPALSGAEFNWPHPILERVEPLIFFGLFLGAHALLKLFSFYAVLQAEPGKRLGSVFWAVAVLVFALGAYVPFTWWLESVRGFQPRAATDLEAYEYEGAYAVARAVPEGALVETDISQTTGAGLTFRWAPVADDTDDDPLAGVFASVTMDGEETSTYSAWVPFDGAGWSVMEVPSDAVPENLTACGVFWYEEQEPKWRSALGIRPIIQEGREVMVAGPFAHAPATAEDARPNVVIVVVDGLGTDRVSEFGGREELTPFLDNFEQMAVVFPNMYTPAPYPESALMTILTGASPLTHGYLGEHQGPLPESCATIAEALGASGYATAAFMEGEARTGFDFGSGFERGFEHYDVSYTTEEPDVIDEDAEPAALGSARTLARALHWINVNQHAKFAVVLYLGELRDMTYHPYYDGAGTTEGKPSNEATYNAGLRHLDEQIGEFVRGLRGLELAQNACVVVTSTHGADFTPPAKLTESVLRIPMWIAAPGLEPVVRRDLASLEQVAPTVAGLAGIDFADTRSLLVNPVTVEPISMATPPLVLTIRNDRWRLYWSTQLDPFTGARSGDSPKASLFDLTRLRTGQTLQDVASQQPDIVQRWTARLQAYLENQTALWR
ncbi:MAG: hypothetical protein AMXMBFR82_52210 [Candidatus Hydrogenedentota bacterium]